MRLRTYAGAGTAILAVVLAGWASFAQPATAQPPEASPANIGSAGITPANVAPQAASAGGVVPKTGYEDVPAVEDCGLGKSQVRPQSLILTCADGNDLAKGLVWSKWSPSVAYARGVDTWNACVPYCAASKTWYSTAATFTLNKPVHTTRGWLFERLTVHIIGPAPRKMERFITFSEAPVVDA